MFFRSREEVIALTPLWQGKRMADGRPEVPVTVLNRLRKLTLEEVWGLPFSQGYEFQSETRLQHTHAMGNEDRLVGRAVTCTCMPLRPDLHYVATSEAKEYGFKGGYNKSAVDRLVEDDVMVVDMFDKGAYGTFFGGNLSTQLKKKTVRGGAVVWGAIRDLDQIRKIDGIQIYYRNVHPTPIRDYVMTDHNGPCRIGEAVCLPGDIVFGSNEGITFIPSYLAEKVADRAEKRHLRDDFGFECLRAGRYSATQIDNLWSDEMWDEFLQWVKTSSKAADYQHLDFTEDVKWMKFMRDHPEEARRQMKGPRTKNPDAVKPEAGHYTI